MTVRTLQVPYDSGWRDRRMGRGPARLWQGGLERLLRDRGHSCRTEMVEATHAHPAEIATGFALCRELARRVQAAHAAGEVPLVLAGNCSSALGTVAGLGPERTGILWFDAHGEFTTPETTTSGFLDGMGLSTMTGHCWTTLARAVPGFSPLPGTHVVMAGVRDVEPAEEALLSASGVRRAGQDGEIACLLDDLRSRVDRIYLHFDLDALDPEEARWNAWCPPGGLRQAEVVAAIRLARERFEVAGVAFASYDPECDRDHRACQAALSFMDALLDEP